jgi:hypothetical protein
LRYWSIIEEPTGRNRSLKSKPMMPVDKWSRFLRVDLQMMIYGNMYIWLNGKDIRKMKIHGKWMWMWWNVHCISWKINAVRIHSLKETEDLEKGNDEKFNFYYHFFYVKMLLELFL